MQLQPEDAAALAVAVVDVHAQLAVDVGADLAALGDDLVVVPFAALDVGVAGLVPEDAAPVLVVELAPPAGADVGLRAAHVAAGQRLAAELDAAVLLVGHQLHLQREAEIAGEEVAAEEL